MDSNGGKLGAFVSRFNHTGTFRLLLSFHAYLDGNNQPVAPDPEGGIHDANGNFGTPTMGAITVERPGKK